MRTSTMLILAGLFLVGCDQPYVTKERLDRGLVIVLPGVEGRSPFNEAICDGLAAGGVDCAMEIYDWTSWLGPLYNLRAENHNRVKARELVARIVRYRMSRPGRPVVLVGQSGGGVVGLWTAEEMPPGEKIDGLIMLAPSVSPQYALDEALGNCRRGIVSFYSSRDWLILGVATTVAGTMDGRHASSAGWHGFEISEGKRQSALYAKFHQIAWTREMAEKGHRGDHFTTGAPRYVATYVAPFVLHEQWTDELVARVLEASGNHPDARQASSAASRPAGTVDAPAAPRRNGDDAPGS